jgi:serine phosphatase RsbU (regulator of sigma subunit)
VVQGQDELGAPSPAPRSFWRIGRSSLSVLLVGLVATGFLSFAAYRVNSHTEDRLLDLQTKQTGTVLQVILPTIETPLSSAAQIAATGNGDPARFRAYISSFVGAKATFISVSLFDLQGATPQLLATVGTAPELTAVPGRAATVLTRAAGKQALSVTGLLSVAQPRIGYTYPSAGARPTYAVYAESGLPANRHVTVAKGSPFADLRFALYLGRSADPAMLVETNAGHLPLAGRTSTVVVPFGASALTLVASSGQLGGTLSGWLWWIVAVLGGLATLAAALAAEHLVRGRRAAERLTGEVQQLLGEQRGIAETLQRALLPRAMPAIAGVQIAVRYIPGVNGVDIGGDWYDVISLDDERFFFVVGDVSGRGVDAGAVMASLHFAIRGFVSEGHPPADILGRLAPLLDVSADSHFATVVCGIADVRRHEIAIANAGHLPPLVISGDHNEFASSPVGPPIGVSTHPTYTSASVSVPARATLIAYTDGLVERRGESLDAGLERLQDCVRPDNLSLEDLLSTIVTDLAHDGSDDIAILGVRWLT